MKIRRALENSGISSNETVCLMMDARRQMDQIRLIVGQSFSCFWSTLRKNDP